MTLLSITNFEGISLVLYTNAVSLPNPLIHLSEIISLESLMPEQE